MIRRPPRSTLLTHSFPTRRSSDLNNLVGQYAVLVRTTQDAAVDDGHFFTPDGQYWRNGLDGKAQLQEAIAIFNTIDEALEAVCEKLLSATRHIAFFKVQHHDHHPSCLILVEKLCLGVNPPEIGRAHD